MMEAVTGTDEHPPDEASVLSSLPGTRPQRRSPKRAAPKPDATGPAETTRAPQETTRRPRPPRARRSPAAAEPAEPNSPKPSPPAGLSAAGDPPTQPPAQGFEANPLHTSLNPPTGGELLASVAQGVAELVEIGLALTRRLAHSVLDRLPRL